VTLPTGASALSEAKTIIFVVADGSDDIIFTDGTSTVTGSAGEQIICSWDGSNWTVIDGGQKPEQSIQFDTNDKSHITAYCMLEVDGACRYAQTIIQPTADNVVANMHASYGDMVSALSLYVGNNVVSYNDLSRMITNSRNMVNYVAVRDKGNIYSEQNNVWVKENCTGLYTIKRVEDTGLGYSEVFFGWANDTENLLYYVAQGFQNTSLFEVYEVVINDGWLGHGIYHRVERDFIKMQPALQSGVSLKTVNGQSLLGSGNITISGGGGSGIQAASFVLYNLSGQITTVASTLYPLTLTPKFPQLSGRDWLSANQTTGVISFTGAGVYKVEGGLGLSASSTNRVVTIKFTVLNNGTEVQGQTVTVGDTTAGGSGGNPTVVAIPSFEVLIESGYTLKIEFSTDSNATFTFDTDSSSLIITKTAEIS
jgi:hypothetical protein